MFSKISKLSMVLSVVGSLFLGSTMALADVFLYTDNDLKFTFSVPDSWKQQTPVSPNTRVKFVAPVPEDYASCKVVAEEDGRFKIYPKRLMGKVMKEYFNADFWEKEATRRFNNPEIRFVGTSSGLDKGDASMAQVVYYMNLGEGTEPVKMYAILLTSVYGDVRYTMICSSSYKSYPKWSDLFGSIISSMTLDERYVAVPTGHYRNFLADKQNPIPRLGIGD